jgi:hypothetical protein
MRTRIATASALFSACSLLAGCNTTPTPMAEAREVPKDRVLTSLNVRSERPARLSLIRDQGFQGIEHAVELWINGVQLARLRAGEIYQTSIDPGSVLIEVRMFNYSERIIPAQVEATLSPGQNYVYRAGLDGSLRMHLIRDLELSK